MTRALRLALISAMFPCVAAADGFTTTATGPSHSVLRCYLGAYAMGSFGQTDVAMASLVSINNLGDFSVGGGPRIGCDYIAGKFGVGAFADYTFRARPETTQVVGLMTAPGVGNEGSVGLRAGVFPTDSTYVYGLVAYTKAEGRSMAMGPFSVSLGGPDGVALGGGIETKLLPNTTLSLEFRHINFADSTGSLLSVLPVDKRETENQVRVGLNFSFSGR